MAICKLTGRSGKFIKSHIIPKALTRKEKGGQYFVQAGQGGRPTKRFDSWYDQNIVVQEGEDILTNLDTWAIQELRKHKLVWSGWGPLQKLVGHKTIDGTPWGIRTIENIDTSKLRLFFLSILWRSAVSERYEFSEVNIGLSELEALRKMIVEGNPNPISLYAISLSQISTLGHIHNMTPLLMEKSVPGLGESPDFKIPIYRFYFDGLIAHFHINEPFDGYSSEIGDLILGNEEKITLSTVTYEESFEKLNLDAVMLDAAENWPSEAAKLF